MDLFNHLLGSEGCNVDGTVGSNPFTSLVDNVFENQFVSGPGFQSSGDGGVYYVEESAANNGAVNATQVYTVIYAGKYETVEVNCALRCVI